jgi:RNA polymerase sigma-70 factor (ECF subfamily)
MEHAQFQDLIHRVRAGDQDAAAELVRTYEPAIRRAVRVRLSDPRLARTFDSMDVAQSVLASFFVRAALGQYDLDRPEQLLNLLATMARYKLADQVDRQRAKRRDNRRVADTDADEQGVPDQTGSPSQHAAARELLEEVTRRLTPDERRLADLRGRGLEWTEIAEQVGANAEACRKRYVRALDRVAKELGLAEAEGEA